MKHYHIRWSSKKALDWEAFDSRAGAEANAAQLVRPGETYTIEEHDETCPRCLSAFKLKASHDGPVAPPKYHWQQAVLDAFESAPESLPLKVNAAQRAIAARLQDPTPMPLNEQIAFREALQSLSALLPDRKPKKETSDKKYA